MKKTKITYYNDIPDTAIAGEYAVYDGYLWKCSVYSPKLQDAIKWRIVKEWKLVKKYGGVCKDITKFPKSLQRKEFPK